MQTSSPLRCHRRLLTVVPGLALVPLLLSACGGPSTETLQGRGEEQPGVIRVDVEQGGGEGDIPFEDPPKYVTVWMEEESTADQVMAILDAYDEDIGNDDVDSVEVILAGLKNATLALGEGVHGSQELVGDLIGAQHDDGVVSYRYDAYPVLPSVSLTLVPGDFDEVVATADRYPEPESVTVISGQFVLIRDRANERPEITSAREALVERVGAVVALQGATVSGRGPLRLDVSSADKAEVRALVADVPDPLFGRVVVRTSRVAGA